MKISEITLEQMREYLRAETETDNTFLGAVMAAAKKMISGYTDIPDDELDNYEDLTIAYQIICSDMYEVRSLTVASDKMNPTVNIILNMYSRNLV